MFRVAIATGRIVLMTVVAIALLAVAAIAYARSQGMLVLSVQSGSMQPAIRRGDAVLVRQMPTQLRPGDIVSFHSLEHPDVIITHRLVSIDRVHGQLVTRGDALHVTDPAFSMNRVVGVSTVSIPLAGYVLDFVRQPVGLMLAVYLPAICMVVWEIKRLMSYYARQRYTLYYY